MVVDFTLLTTEVKFYISQLGLPEENSHEFQRMTSEQQEKLRFWTKFCVISGMQIANHLAKHVKKFTVEEISRYIPLVGGAIAGSISFSSTYYFLHGCLDELEKAALDFLEKLPTEAVGDVDSD
jgi:ABC-type multidrug transport system permease subunit